MIIIWGRETLCSWSAALCHYTEWEQSGESCRKEEKEKLKGNKREVKLTDDVSGLEAGDVSVFVLAVSQQSYVIYWMSGAASERVECRPEVKPRLSALDPGDAPSSDSSYSTVSVLLRFGFPSSQNRPDKYVWTPDTKYRSYCCSPLVWRLKQWCYPGGMNLLTF